MSRREFLRAVSAAGVAGLLSACGIAIRQPGEPIVARPTAPPIQPPPTSIPVVIPTRAAPPTLVPAAPTSVPPTSVPPTSVPPTSVPPTAPGPLLGAEWIVLASGDLYASEVETAIGYRPSGLRPDGVPTEFADFRLLADQVVIVQRNPQGQPWVRALVQPGRVYLNGATTPFSPWQGEVSGYLMALSQAGSAIRLLPLDARGRLAGQGLGLSWSSAGRQIEVSTLVPPQPQPAPITLSAEPASGGPGTSVTVRGSGYAPGITIAIRLGLPGPVGEVLATGSVAADGSVAATLVMPDRLPSGDEVLEGALALVAMDSANRALASAPFSYARVRLPAMLLTADRTRGGPGSVVLVTGEGFAPRTPITIRLGAPGPVGPPLAGVMSDAQGRWGVGVAIPEGEPPAGQSLLVACDPAGAALSGAPFTIEAGAEADVSSVTQPAQRLLDTWASGGDVRPLLSASLRAAAEAGRPIDQLLGLPPIAIRRTVIGRPLPPAEVFAVPAWVDYDSYGEQLYVAMVVEGGRWRVAGVAR